MQQNKFNVFWHRLNINKICYLILNTGSTILKMPIGRRPKKINRQVKICMIYKKWKKMEATYTCQCMYMFFLFQALHQDGANIPVSVVWIDKEYFYSPLDGMLVHHRVTPSTGFTGTHLYPRVEQWQIQTLRGGEGMVLIYLPCWLLSLLSFLLFLPKIKRKAGP